MIALAGDFIHNNYPILNELLIYWRSHRENFKKIENRNSIGNIETLLLNCQSNKNTEWYDDAFVLLIKYYLILK